MTMLQALPPALRLVAVLVLGVVISACAAATPTIRPSTPPSSAPSLAATQQPAASATAGTAQPATVRMAFPNLRSIQNYPTYLAQETGYFEAEGLTVNMEVIAGSQAIAQQLLAGNLDVGLMSATTAIQAQANDQELVVFYTVAYQNGFTLVTKEGGEIASVADLEGGVVGITELSGGEVPLVQAVMSSAGLAEGTDYSLLAVGDGGAVTFQALEDDDVDAYSSSIFDVASLRAAGLTLVSILPDQFRYIPSTSFVTTRQVLDAQPDVLARFGRAIAKATIFGQTNREAANAMAEPYNPELFEDPEFVDAVWEATLGYYAPPPRMEGQPMGAHDIEAYEQYIEVASQAPEDEGGLAGPVTAEEVADSSLIAEINDFDAAAVRAEAEAWPAP